MITRVSAAGSIVNRLVDAAALDTQEMNEPQGRFDPTLHDGERDWFAARTALKERGTDVRAVRGLDRWHVEVKGYPSAKYADPHRAQEKKRARPGSRAHHWYAEVLLAAIKLRDRYPDERVAIALADMARYHDLHAEAASSLAALRIEVILVNENSRVGFLGSAVPSDASVPPSIQS